MGLPDINYDELNEFLDDVRERMPIKEDGDLFVECRDQPMLYWEVSQRANFLKSAVKRVKAILEYKKGELLVAIKRNPSQYNIAGKVSDKVAEATALQHKDYQKILEDYFDIEECYDGFQCIVRAVEQRKSMLRDIVSMTLYNYYTSSSRDMNAAQSALTAQGEQQIIKMRRERIRGQKAKSKQKESQEEG
jgi:hypothetical protein